MITTSHLYPGRRCHSHSRTLSPALQITAPVAYTFRILAIGGIAFNLAWRRPQETTNILFKHLTNTRCPGRARSAVCLGRNNSVASANNSETETPGEKEGKRRDRGCLFCYYPRAQVRRAAYLGAFVRLVDLFTALRSFSNPFPPFPALSALHSFPPFPFLSLLFSLFFSLA